MTQLAWRLIQTRFTADPLNYDGARRSGGRWNSPGTPALYAADSPALAALECLVHIDDVDWLSTYQLFQLRLPEPAGESIAEGPYKDLPADWRRSPAPPALRQWGDAWLARQAALGLWLPSAIIPLQRNLLLNPLHPAFARISVEGPVAWNFDTRLYRKD